MAKYRESYAKESGFTTIKQCFIESIVLKKTLECIYYKYSRVGEDNTHESLQNVVLLVKVDFETTETKISVRNKMSEE